MLFSMVTPALSRLLIALVMAFVVAVFMAQNKKMMHRAIAVLFVFAFLGGFSIYTLGYLSSNANFSDTLWAAMRGIYSTARMFFINDDYGYLIDSPQAQFLNDSVWLQIIFWFCHVAAVFLTISALIAVLGRKLTDNIRIWFHARLPLGNKCHYIVIGCGKSAEVFLDDLQKNISKENITVITGESEDDDSADKYEEFTDKGYAIIKSKADEDVLKKAGVEKLRRKTKVIAITENDEQNLEIANIIVKKIHVQVDQDDKAACLENINLEAYIMYSHIENTDHFAFAENAYGKVRFFSPYELQTRSFFSDNPVTRFIPDLIDTDKARLKGAFNADGKIIKQDGSEYRIKNIFIGFGAVNYQMLKGSIMTGQLLGCDYNAIIYDNNADAEKPSARQAMFMNKAKGLFPGGDQTIPGEEYLESPKEKYNIIFKNGDVLAKNFYTAKDGIINEVIQNDFTAIYIALGDDKFNVETACEIRQCLYEHGVVSNKKLRIFVKIDQNSVFDDELVINNPQNIINYDQSSALKIQCYGAETSIFTKDIIVNETLDDFARAFANQTHGTPWGLLTKTKQDSNRQLAMSINVKLNLLGFRLLNKDDEQGNGQDINIVDDNLYYKKYSNAANENIAQIIDLSRKIALCGNEATLKELNTMRAGYILNYMQTENGQAGGVICDTPRNNLARLEHLRWDTFYLAQGWSKLPLSKIDAGNSGRQNRFTKQHACLTTFEGLIQLRRMQAEKERNKNPAVSMEEAEANADTIWYDYNLMDELICRLSSANYKVLNAYEY